MNGFERDWIDWWNWMLNRETSGNVLGGRSSGGRVLRPPQQIGAAVRLVEVFAAAGRFQQIPVRQVQRSRLPGTRSRQAAELPRCNNLSGQGHNLTGSLFDLDAADVMATWIEPRQKPVVWTSANAVAIFCYEVYLLCLFQTVMADERLNKSEALFTFLHNIPVCLRPSVDVPKKRFFLATLFKGWLRPSCFRWPLPFRLRDPPLHHSCTALSQPSQSSFRAVLD